MSRRTDSGSNAARRVEGRRWCVPPVILYNPRETLDGVGILSEMPDEDLGLLLWRTFRDVALWGQTPQTARSGLFDERSQDERIARLAATELPAAIASSVDTISAMLTLGDRADAGVLTVCCLEVAAWARSEGLVQTSVGFAQAAALSSPANAEAALHTGRAASAAGQDARAGTWLRRALGLSRREKDWNSYAAALVELGILYERQEGEARRAEHYFRLGLRAGRRFSLPDARMRSAHGLLRTTQVRGDHASAARAAAVAQRAYRPGAEGATALLLDLARFWTDADELGRARAALRRIAPTILAQADAYRLSAGALIARAFSGRDARGRKFEPPTGRTAAIQNAWRFLQVDRIPEGTRFAAAIDLAHAAQRESNREAFDRAKREVLRTAPAEMYEDATRKLAALWPPETT